MSVITIEQAIAHLNSATSDTMDNVVMWNVIAAISDEKARAAAIDQITGITDNTREKGAEYTHVSLDALEEPDVYGSPLWEERRYARGELLDALTDYLPQAPLDLEDRHYNEKGVNYALVARERGFWGESCFVHDVATVDKSGRVKPCAACIIDVEESVNELADNVLAIVETYLDKMADKEHVTAACDHTNGCNGQWQAGDLVHVVDYGTQDDFDPFPWVAISDTRRRLNAQGRERKAARVAYATTLESHDVSSAVASPEYVAMYREARAARREAQARLQEWSREVTAAALARLIELDGKKTRAPRASGVPTQAAIARAAKIERTVTARAARVNRLQTLRRR